MNYRSIDAEFDEDETVDLGGKFLYEVRYGQIGKKLLKSRCEPKEKFGFPADILKYFLSKDGKFEIYYENNLKTVFYVESGGIHNLYGPAIINYRLNGCMSFKWFVDNKKNNFREDNICEISSSIRMKKFYLYIVKKTSEHGYMGFNLTDSSDGFDYYLAIYNELKSIYEKY